MTISSRRFSLIVLVCFAWTGAIAADPAPDVKQLQADFRKLGFGMFIHYNMATYHGQQWVVGQPCPSTFDPGEPIDTDAWADAAKAAGMTYGVLTTKHVAGFCLWDSKLTEYDIMHPKCPVKEDIVAKYVKSFTSRGLKAGLYYCWRSPGFDDKFKVLPPECDPATHTLAQQIEFQKKQIAELVEKFPDAFYIWNDSLDDMIMPAEEATAWTRSLSPHIIACGNWWNWGKKGRPFLDIAVTETRHFPETNTHPGETCWKLEQQWFWQEGFRTVANGETIAKHIHTAQSRNANFLLNVGPDKQGRILESSRKVLAEIPAALARHAQVADDLKNDVEAMLKIGVPENSDAPPDRPVASKPLPKVLLIGDSISGGYLGGVQTQLKNEAEVVRGNNGGTTIDGLEKIEEILGDTKWDVIHFNWGLHDMTWQRRMQPGERGIEAYAERLEQLVRRLTQTKAKLVWATTTPWPGNYAYYESRFGEKLVYSTKQEKEWGDAALAVMRKHEIPVNDLHALLKPKLEKYQKPDDVHFNNEGSQAMAGQIASVVRPLLPKHKVAK